MYAPALISTESSCSTFARRCSSSSLSPNQQTPQSFIIPLSLFQWKQSTVTVFLYRCSRPRFAFIPSLSPCNILPASLLSLNPKQIHLKPLSLPQTSYLPYHPLLLLLSLPLSFFIQENYTQLFLNPVCCFLLFFLSIHLSLSFFSFSSLVSLCSLGLRLSLYLSLRWRLRGGNDGAFWLKQVERPPKPKPLNRELTACPLLTLICAHTYTCAREDPIHDRDNTTCLQTDFSSLKKKVPNSSWRGQCYVPGSFVSGISIRRLRAQYRRQRMTTEMWLLLGGARAWKHTSITAAQILKKCNMHVKICTDTIGYFC